MIRTQSLLAAAVTVLLLAACSNQTAEPAVDPTDLSRNSHFASDDGQLTSRLKLQSIGERRDGDLLRFQAILLNDWHAEVSFKYQVLWYDEGNMLVGAESRPWHAVRLQSGTVHSIEATAPKPSANRYVIQLLDE